VSVLQILAVMSVTVMSLQRGRQETATLPSVMIPILISMYQETDLSTDTTLTLTRLQSEQKVSLTGVTIQIPVQTFRRFELVAVLAKDTVLIRTIRQ